MAAGLRSGAATLGWVRVAELADLVPEVAALSVPFLFRDPEKALAISTWPRWDRSSTTSSASRGWSRWAI